MVRDPDPEDQIAFVHDRLYDAISQMEDGVPTAEAANSIPEIEATAQEIERQAAHLADQMRTLGDIRDTLERDDVALGSLREAEEALADLADADLGTDAEPVGTIEIDGRTIELLARGVDSTDS